MVASDHELAVGTANNPVEVVVEMHVVVRGDAGDQPRDEHRYFPAARVAAAAVLQRGA